MPVLDTRMTDAFSKGMRELSVGLLGDTVGGVFGDVVFGGGEGMVDPGLGGPLGVFGKGFDRVAKGILDKGVRQRNTARAAIRPNKSLDRLRGFEEEVHHRWPGGNRASDRADITILEAELDGLIRSRGETFSARSWREFFTGKSRLVEMDAGDISKLKKDLANWKTQLEGLGPKDFEQARVQRGDRMGKLGDVRAAEDMTKSKVSKAVQPDPHKIAEDMFGGKK